MVEVRVFGGLWEHLGPSLELDLGPDEVTVANLIEHLGIDPAEVGIVTVNRRQVTLTAIVPCGSRVSIFPPLSGG